MRSVTLIAAGTALGQLIGFAAAPLITRLYTPEQFGVLGAFASLLGMTGIVATLRFEVGIPIAKNDQQAAEVGLMALLSTAGVALIATAIGFGLSGVIATRLGQPQLVHYIWLLPVAILIVGSIQTLNYWAIRKRDFTRISRMKFSQGIGTAAMQIGLGWMGLGSLGLLLGDTFGRAIGGTSVVTDFLRKDAQRLQPIGFTQLQLRLLEFWRFPVFSGSSAFINAAGLQLPTLLLATLYGAHIAGFYTLAWRMVGGVQSLIEQSISQVYIAQLAEHKHASKQERLKLFTGLAKRLAGVSLLILMPLFFLAPQLFEWGFGAQWKSAGLFVQALIPMWLTSFIVVPMSQTLNVLQRQDLQLGWDIARLLTTLGVFSLPNYLHLEVTSTLLIYSLTQAFLYCLLFGLSMYVVKKQEEFPQ